MLYRLFLALLLTVFAASINAKQFIPPEQITYSGKTYELAYKNSAPNGRAIYEYTANKEPVENWTSLITINYAKSMVTTPLNWLGTIKLTLDSQKPKPHYGLYVKESHGYSKIIYEPDSKNPSYESNVHKSFHQEACDGLVVFQFAQKYPASKDQSSESKLDALKHVAKENFKLTEEIEKSEWLPNCE